MSETPSETKNCLLCGKEFTPKRYWQRFHADHCRNTFHTMTRQRYMEELGRARSTVSALQAQIEQMKAVAVVRVSAGGPV